MVRARLPLAVALLAATLVIPATAASAAGNSSSSDPAGVTKQVTGQSSGSGSSGTDSTAGTDQSSTGGTDSSQSGTSGTGTTTSGNSNNPSLPDLSGSDAGSNPFDPSTLNDVIDKVTGGAGGGGTPDLAGALTTLQGCLSDAPNKEKPLLAGQQCFENFIATLTGDPRAKCFSENNFTLQFVEDRLMSGEPPSQQDLTDFQNNLAGLIACLNPSSPPTTGGGGGASADTATPTPEATSDVAPAATAVTGTPNFTG
jgi:hypothetical protein